METAEEKLAFLGGARLSDIASEEISPDKNANWLNLTHNDFDELMPVASKEAKAATSSRAERVMFRVYSLGISTNRDEWLYADDQTSLLQRVEHLVAAYEAQKPDTVFSGSLKWSETLKRRARGLQREAVNLSRIRRSAYRPFYSPLLYQSELFIDRPGLVGQMFPIGADNLAICFSDVGARTDFVVLAVAGVADLHFGSSIDAYQQLPQYRFDAAGHKTDNITDWSLNQFRNHYKAGPGKRLPEPDKEGIFHYVYAVLHDPAYREKYALNLKREFPRIPLHGSVRADFWRWADWGRELMDLHIGYESVAPCAEIVRRDIPDEKARAAG
jgi:predicted helicase